MLFALLAALGAAEGLLSGLLGIGGGIVLVPPLLCVLQLLGFSSMTWRLSPLRPGD